MDDKNNKTKSFGESINFDSFLSGYPVKLDDEKLTKWAEILKQTVRRQQEETARFFANLQKEREDEQRKRELEELQLAYLKKQLDTTTNINTNTNTNTATPGRESDKRRREKQIDEICDTAKSLGYDLLKIPEGGKAQIKAICLKHNSGFFTESGFNHAWKAANQTKKISMENKEKYLSKQ